MVNIKKSGGRVKQYTKQSKRFVSLPSNNTITKEMLQPGVIEENGVDKVSDLIFNVGLLVEEDTPTTNNVKISLTTGLGGELSVTDVAKINFRSATETSGVTSTVEITSTIDITIPEGATLGCTDGAEARIFIYAINNSGTVELAVSKTFFSEDRVHSTTAISAASDSDGAIYSTTARTDVPIRYIGHFETTEATAGNWTTEPTIVHVGKARKNRLLQRSALIDGYETWASYAEHDIPNASVTITTDGGPVFLGLQGVASSLRVNDQGNTGGATISFKFYRDTTLVGGGVIGIEDTETAGIRKVTFPSSSLWCIDTPPPGTYTYKLAYSSSYGRIDIDTSYLKAIEMC